MKELKAPAEQSAGEQSEKITLPPEQVTVELHFPVKHPSESEPIKRIVLRRPRAKDMRILPAEPGVGDLLNLAAKLSGYPPSVIDLLEMPDWGQVSKVLNDFLQGGRTSGEKSSD